MPVSYGMRCGISRESFGWQPSAPVPVDAARARLLTVHISHNEPDPSQTSFLSGTWTVAFHEREP
jgi:hypothetical protein